MEGWRFIPDEQIYYGRLRKLLPSPPLPAFNTIVYSAARINATFDLIYLDMRVYASQACGGSKLLPSDVRSEPAPHVVCIVPSTLYPFGSGGLVFAPTFIFADSGGREGGRERERAVVSGQRTMPNGERTRRREGSRDRAGGIKRPERSLIRDGIVKQIAAFEHIVALRPMKIGLCDPDRLQSTGLFLAMSND